MRGGGKGVATCLAVGRGRHGTLLETGVYKMGQEHPALLTSRERQFEGVWGAKRGRPPLCLMYFFVRVSFVVLHDFSLRRAVVHNS